MDRNASRSGINLYPINKILNMVYGFSNLYKMDVSDYWNRTNLGRNLLCSPSRVIWTMVSSKRRCFNILRMLNMRSLMNYLKFFFIYKISSNSSKSTDKINRISSMASLSLSQQQLASSLSLSLVFLVNNFCCCLHCFFRFRYCCWFCALKFNEPLHYSFSL